MANSASSLSQTPATPTTRRAFVRTLTRASLAAVAAPWIIPSGIVRAQDGQPVPSNRTTFALIGCGNMGPQGLNAVIKNKNAKVIATCDTFRDRAEKIRDGVDKEYGGKGCTAYQDYRELLARKDLDCLEIATGDYWHVPLGIAAIRAGKDIYIEKPLGIAVNWAKVLRDEINKRKAVFQLGTWQRSRPHYRKACELVRNGVIGDIKRVEVWSPCLAADGIFDPNSKASKLHRDTTEIPVPATLNYDIWTGPAAKRPCTKARLLPDAIYHSSDYAIGYIAGWGVHPIDIAQWGLGADNAAPVLYKGTGRSADTPGLFDTLALWDVECQYANGIELRFMDRVTAAPIAKKYLRRFQEDGTTFFGTKGWISVDRTHAQASDPEILKTELPENAIRLYADKTPVAQVAGRRRTWKADSHWDNFIDCVRTRKPTINTIESAFNDDIVSHLSNIAAKTGRTIKWDPKAETIPDDAEAAKLLDRVPREPWGF
ncbi:MAG: Gfo/Idh/MocA family oxidoreductase [Puniceicoccales bacterium]|jgi:predicted dehydrogenase|nr:Gfo/Idh/MocA family oxidoreductase [Puniceicoccales bacterium]